MVAGLRSPIVLTQFELLKEIPRNLVSYISFLLSSARRILPTFHCRYRSIGIQETKNVMAFSQVVQWQFNITSAWYGTGRSMILELIIDTILWLFIAKTINNLVDDPNFTSRVRLYIVMHAHARVSRLGNNAPITPDKSLTHLRSIRLHRVWSIALTVDRAECLMESLTVSIRLTTQDDTMP